MDPLAIPTSFDVERHPELAVLAALDAALEMTSVSLCAHYPEILPPDWPLGSCGPPEPPAYIANFLITLVHSLRDATRVYRETIARSEPTLAQPDDLDI